MSNNRYNISDLKIFMFSLLWHVSKQLENAVILCSYDAVFSGQLIIMELVFMHVKLLQMSLFIRKSIRFGSQLGCCQQLH